MSGDGEAAAERVEEEEPRFVQKLFPIVVNAMASPKHTVAKVWLITSNTMRACRSVAAATREAHITITCPVVSPAGCRLMVVATGVGEEVA